MLIPANYSAAVYRVIKLISDEIIKMKMQFKLLMQLGVSILTAMLLTSSVFAAKKLHEESLDKIAAIVDESVITESELDQAIESAKKQAMSMNQPLPSDATLHKQVLDQLINRKLQLLLADQLNIHISDADVNQAVNNVAKANGVTADELYNKVTEQGMSAADYRKELREEITLQKVQQQEVGSKIVISPDEVKKAMHASAPQNAMTSAEKEYNIADTLVALPESASSSDIANAQKQANELLEKLRKGTAHADAATTSDLGWRKLDEMPSAFVQPIQHMKKNEFAGPIQTSNGFHLLHLVDVRKGASAASAAPSMQEAEQIVYQRKMEEALKPWIAKLRSGAYINTHPDNAR